MSSAKRVVITALHYHPDSPSGAGRMALDQARHLAGQGHDVWLVCQDLTGQRSDHSIEQGFHLLTYHRPTGHPMGLWKWAFHQTATARLLRKHVHGYIDCLHGHSPLQYDGALQVVGRETRACYTVHSPVRLELTASMRGNQPNERFRLAVSGWLAHRVERRCLRRSSAVTVLSLYTRSLLRGLYGDTLEPRTWLIPGWVDVDHFRIVDDREAAKRALGWPTGVPLFLTVRRLVHRMGLDHLLRAAALLRADRRDFVLMIAGDGPLRPELESFVRAHRLERTVRFAGRVSDDTLPLMYGAADAFVLPSAVLECYGLIAIEALSCGRPVLATPIGAIPEVVGRFEARWIADSSGAEPLAALMARYLDDQLPTHEPDRLRALVVAEHAAARRVAELCAVTLGENLPPQRANGV